MQLFQCQWGPAGTQTHITGLMRLRMPNEPTWALNSWEPFNMFILFHLLCTSAEQYNIYIYILYISHNNFHIIFNILESYFRIVLSSFEKNIPLFNLLTCLWLFILLRCTRWLVRQTHISLYETRCCGYGTRKYCSQLFKHLHYIVDQPHYIDKQNHRLLPILWAQNQQENWPGFTVFSFIGVVVSSLTSVFPGSAFVSTTTWIVTLF